MTERSSFTVVEPPADQSSSAPVAAHTFALRAEPDGVRGLRLLLPPRLAGGSRRRWVLGWLMAASWPILMAIGAYSLAFQPATASVYLAVGAVGLVGLPLLHKGWEIPVMVVAVTATLLATGVALVAAPTSPGSPAGLITIMVLVAATERARVTMFVWGVACGVCLLPLLAMEPAAYEALGVGSDLSSRVAYLIVVGSIAAIGSAASNRLLDEAQERSRRNNELTMRLELGLQNLEAQVAERTEALTRRTAELQMISDELDDSIAREVALAERMRTLAETDDLTGLLNRRGFLATLDTVMPTGGWLALADLDHFKRINDTFGHPTGDVVLATMAELLTSAAPDGATVARIGGEEFAIVLPDGGESPRREADANRMGEELVQAARQLSWVDVLSSREKVTMSIGLARFAPGVADDESISALLRRADRALYTAKALGRDRSVVTTH